MESSDGGTNIADCSAGSIVWVRRRNGSWWPGKILGPDELSASHLMSPRSGTPVKLLGREDASVDWYNLEKSKRVKAFRCGDFDECIERAEASQGMPPKKREKYARREDAILHALELEKQLVEKKYGKLGYSINSSCSKPLDDIEKDVMMCSEQLRCGNEKKSHSRSHQVSRRLHPSLKEGTNQPSLSHDESGAVPRMRGLQDIGLKTASSKSKISSSVTSNDSQKPTFHNVVHDLPNGDCNVGHTLNTKSETPLDKKRKINKGLVDEFLVKRRDRRRPIVQVMQSSAKFSVPLLQPDSDIVSISVSGEDQLLVACHTEKNGLAHLSAESCDHLDDQETHPGQMETLLSKFEENNHLQSAALSGENTSGSTEDTETDSSYTDSFDSDTDEEIDSLSDDAASIELEPKYFGGSLERAEHRSISGEESHDLALADDMSHSCLNDPSSVSTVVSKWQLKGKRNNRNLVKRSLDVSNKKVPRGSIYGTELEEKESDYGSCEATMIEKNCKTQMIDYGSRGLDGTRHLIDLEDFTWNDRPVMKGYREELEEYIDPVFVGRQHFGSRIKSVLVDVDLKVKSSYQREHVPIISLMSKLNGQAIVGHPIQIEALENGSSDALLVGADDCFPELLEKDSALSPVWRTARRTANFRVPRPHVSTLDGDETAKHPQYADKDREACFRKSNAGSSGHKAITTRKSLPRTSTNRKFRRQPKKMSLSSSQKIRTLSSISPLNLSIDLKHSGNSYQVDRLIKPVSVSTALACIPVKLVFSRLNEALVGRH